MPDTEKDKNMSKVPNHLFIRWAQNGMNTKDIIKPVEYSPYINDPENVPKLKFEGYKPEFDLTTSSTTKPTPKTDPVGEIPQPLKRSTSTSPTNQAGVTNPVSSLIGNYAEIDKALQKAGYSKNKRAAILATVEAESSGDPNAKGDYGTSRGLFQWRGPRQQYADLSLQSQIDWMLKELNTIDGNLGWQTQSTFDEWNNSDDLESLVRNLTYNYIRPADKEGDTRKRYALAQKYLKQLS